MIELSQEQRRSLEHGDAVRVRENGLEYILLRSDVYEGLVQEDEYDDGPWTPAEMDLLRQESVDMLDRFGNEP